MNLSTNPKYTHLWEHKFSWGEFEIHIETAANKISEIEVFSDCLIPSFVELLKPTLQGKEFSINGIQTAMKEISVLTQGTESSLFVPDLSKWLLHQLTVTTNDRL
ncbi:hypothetical protein Pelo_19612 [Pelomyxa schiedti]|nr:hypothetical protein Pelo_19612 [Pelomyxa schiedti]